MLCALYHWLDSEPNHWRFTTRHLVSEFGSAMNTDEGMGFPAVLSGVALPTKLGTKVTSQTVIQFQIQMLNSKQP